MPKVLCPIPPKAVAEIEERTGIPLKGWDRCPPRFVSARPSARGLVFDVDAVVRVLLALRDLPHTKGRQWGGTPFVAAPWQIVWIIAPVFGWKRRNGRRLIRELWYEVPRKAGKSSLAARLALILLAADDEWGAEVYAAATTTQQARQVGDDAAMVVRASPVLSGVLQVQKDLIKAPNTGGIFRVLSRIADAAHGLNVSGGVIDEVHVHKSRDLIDAIETGTAAREDPLLIYITTAGDDDETTIYAEKHNYAVKLTKGEAHNEGIWVVIWAAADDADPLDEATWAACNPNFPASPTLQYLQEKADKARTEPSFMPTFKRLHLNIRGTAAAAAWPGAEAWPRGAGMVLEDKLKGKPALGGLVAASASDLSAVCWVFKNPEGPGRWFLWRWFIPAGGMDDLDRRTDGVASSVWVKQGMLRVTEGDVLDHAAHIDQITRDAKTFDVSELGYDPNGSIGIVSPLMEANVLDCVPFYATSPGSSLLDWERLLRSGDANHGGDAIAAWQVHHLRVKDAATGVLKIDRRASTDNVFGIAAGEIALRLALMEVEKKPATLVSF